MKGSERFEVHGCPYKHIPRTVGLFYGDYTDLQDGILAPYRHDEFPNKLAEMILARLNGASPESLQVEWQPAIDIGQSDGPCLQP